MSENKNVFFLKKNLISIENQTVSFDNSSSKNITPHFIFHIAILNNILKSGFSQL